MKPMVHAVTVVAAMVAAASFVAAPVEAKGPQKRKATLFVHDTRCEHELETKPVKLEKAKAGALGLRIRNDCGIQRRAMVCIYDAQGQRATPFAACTSVPPGVGLGTPFTLEADGGAAEIDCVGQTEGSYFAMLLVADAVRPSGCPTAPPKERMVGAGEQTFNHRLAIEIGP